MIQYRVKSSKGMNTFMEIVKQRKDGYDVRITCVYEDYKKEIEEYLSKELFRTCLRTGYLTPIPSDAGELISA